MARFAAFLDACVLVPIAPCDTMLRIADYGAFRPLWSTRVIQEARTALERIHPTIDPSRFQSRFRSMNAAFDDALVKGWEPLENGIELPDPNDRHVAAAALRGRADMIVTQNIKDFPADIMRSLGLQAIRPDDFLLDQFELDQVSTVRVIVEQSSAMVNPPVSPDELLTRLAKGGVPKFAQAIRERLQDNNSGNKPRS